MNITANQIQDPILKIVHFNEVTIPQNKFFIYHDKSRKVIDTSSILMIQSTSNYSTIYLDNGEKIFTSRTLKYWEELFNCASLMRIHRSYLINHLKINSIQNNKVFLRTEKAFMGKDKFGKNLFNVVPMFRSVFKK